MHNNILENLIQQYVKKCNNTMAKWSLPQFYKICWTFQNLGLNPTPTDTSEALASLVSESSTWGRFDFLKSISTWNLLW